MTPAAAAELLRTVALTPDVLADDARLGAALVALTVAAGARPARIPTDFDAIRAHLRGPTAADPATARAAA